MTMNFSSLSNEDLINSYGAFLTELRDRGIIRSKNVVGDLGEYIAIDFYNKTPGLPNMQAAPQGTQNVDALSRNGDRYSIKSTTGRVTGAFWGLPPKGSNEIPDKRFEYVILVLLDDNYNLIRINELTWEQFLNCKRWHSTMRAWNISITNGLLENTKNIFNRS
ncbi:MAG: hypothetical protein GY861_24095 [bacterium]|nr:hypothetical protein [bacterium]